MADQGATTWNQDLPQSTRVGDMDHELLPRQFDPGLKSVGPAKERYFRGLLFKYHMFPLLSVVHYIIFPVRQLDQAVSELRNELSHSGTYRLISAGRSLLGVSGIVRADQISWKNHLTGPRDAIIMVNANHLHLQCQPF